ncbi:MAG: uroporphyrinogen decarboxylase family protein [Kiritimatiellae bacterium]|nr:uroporphyrinogen decarboxylase family protein [Kiritimatiellia bacterium]
MNSRELTQRAIHFGHPQRLPFMGSIGKTDFSGDVVAIFPEFSLKYWLGGGGTDEWGCRWEVDPGFKDMGQVKNTVLPRLEDFETVTIPDALNPSRYAAWEPILARAEREGKYVVLCNGCLLFERAHFLHGFENTLMDSVLEPERMRAFLRHVARYHLDTIRYVREHFAGRIHGYRGTDDWGSQTGPLVSPRVFADVYQPVYAEVFAAIHEAGMDVWMHSCGQNLALLPLLIESGLNVVNLMQPNVFPLPRLAELRGRVCFEVCADVQATLPHGDRDLLASEIQALLDTCCTDGGGVIESTLDRMWLDAEGLDPEIAALCHREYRSRDPFRRRSNSKG